MEAAFFDLDKTVIAKTSIIAYAPTLRKNGYLSIPMAVRTAWGHLLFKFFGADEKSLDKARKTALRLATGMNQKAMKRLVRDNLTEVIEPIVYDDAIDLIPEILDADSPAKLLLDRNWSFLDIILGSHEMSHNCGTFSDCKIQLAIKPDILALKHLLDTVMDSRNSAATSNKHNSIDIFGCQFRIREGVMNAIDAFIKHILA